MRSQVEFHDAMVAAIPSLVQLLDNDRLESSALSVLAKLADHGEFQPSVLVT